MSVRELKRGEVLARVKSGALTLKTAAELMGVCYRQAKRLWRRFRRSGTAGLRHRGVGRRSNRRKTSAFRRKVLAIVTREFGGDAEHERFGPTLTAEHLHEEYHLDVDPETLRRWMLAAGLWSRTRDAPKHRRRRERKAHFGELVQLDGSFEGWLEDRGPTSCLMNMVDDATGQCWGRFEPQETIWGAVRALRGWIERYGIPRALYTDWKNVYVRRPTALELAAGEVALTQFGRMCAKLGIRIIAASSPQAKGRVERSNGTHQDRLIKKLRRRGVRTYEQANDYLATTYWTAHNTRFASAAASPEDFHTRVPSDVDLEQVFRIETERTVNNDWVVRHDSRLLQIERRQRVHPPARSTVLVCEYEDGHLEICYRNQRVRWTEISGLPPQPTPDVQPASARPGLASRNRTPGVVVLRQRPAARHPWRPGWKHLCDHLGWSTPKNPRRGNGGGVDEQRTLAHTSLEIVQTGSSANAATSSPHDSHIPTVPHLLEG